MLHAPAQRDKYEGNRPGQSGVSRYVEHGIGWVWQGYTGVWSLVRLSSWWKLTLNIQWTYSERNIEHTLNTVQKAANSSKSVQLIVIFRKNTNIEFSFDFQHSLFPSVSSVFYASFTACSMYVQCTFTVSSLRAHGTCRKKYEVCEGRRGKRNRLYFEVRLCSFVFATVAERALCSGYCWWTKSCTTLFAP